MKTQFISAARLSVLALSLSAGVLVGGDASAQDAPIVGKAMLGVSVTEAQLVATGWRASKMIHTDVYNEKDEKIGRVDDLIVSPDGTLSAAIIDVGGLSRDGDTSCRDPDPAFSADGAQTHSPGRKQRGAEKAAGVRVCQGLTLGGEPAARGADEPGRCGGSLEQGAWR
ncbi:PRC-barrel domain-containing protein [Achromobacter dolens]|uniref:PRC-barrel domain-containing protein n=1 Tax=Achromobacter dolens TaxID=1287738 RepID=UPI003B9CB256